jgi:hypothetical protein
MILSLLSCGSAKRIDFLNLPFDTSSKLSPSDFTKSISPTYTHVFLDFEESNSKMEAAIKPLLSNGGSGGGHKAGIVNLNWVKQCLITGNLESSERIKKQE